VTAKQKEICSYYVANVSFSLSISVHFQKTFDKNTGKIAASELRELMSFMGQNPSDEDLELFKTHKEVESKGGLDWLTFLSV
jgi:Ca2+-binding EF-hand superfamily protein